MFNLERGLKHMSISKLTLKSKGEPVRRVEVFNGNGRRREWSDDQKDGVLCGAAWGDSAATVHMATARPKAAEVLSVPEEDPMFAPAVVVSPGKPEPKKARRARSPRKASPEAAIELQIDGPTLRIASGTDATTIVAVIQALKAQS
ncbi:hypothetical protein [Rhizobium leguminosarum]|uniref:hypothetical protein n=1 Tax=Rhizobium leguminosarum TaxID=384 RepID=UPI001C900940|nr:hypothetical protein [Rhizobium leguminosarum]MBY3003580.1 hypothetical protein [Rhizobium leguminosarum]MBY3027064.1 hypothetical protein [Rhizobium leguminosarum]